MLDQRLIVAIILVAALAAGTAYAQLQEYDQAARDVVVSGIVYRGDVATTEPVSALVIAHAAAGRCDWSASTGDDGRFARVCYSVTEGDSISLVVIRANPRHQLWEDSLVVPAEGTAMATVAVWLPTPMEPPATPTVLDHLGWDSLPGSVSFGPNPVVGAVVRVWHCRGQPGGCLSPVVTDSDGVFEVWCHGGHSLYTYYCVRIEADGHRPYQVELPIGRGSRLDVDLGIRTATPTPTNTPTPSPTATVTPSPTPTATPTLEPVYVPRVVRRE